MIYTEYADLFRVGSNVDLCRLPEEIHRISLCILDGEIKDITGGKKMDIF